MNSGVGRVRVLVFTREPGGEPAGVTRAYHEISSALAGTPGLIGNELMRSAADPGAFVVMSEWTSLAAFRAWERSPGHRVATSPLRRFQDSRGGPAFGIYVVEAAY